MHHSLSTTARCGVFFFLILLALNGRAQQSFLHSYSVSDGLPSNEVYDIFQDSNGFLWFATDAGASRYDGYTFVNFTSRDGLPDNVVFSFFEDAHGRIWFRTYSGLLSYYDGSRIIQPAVNTQLRALLKGSVVNSIYVDEHDTLWMGLSGDRPLLCVPPGFRSVSPDSFPLSDPITIREMARGAYIISERKPTTDTTVWFTSYGSGQRVDLDLATSINSVRCEPCSWGGTLVSSRNAWWLVKNGEIGCEGKGGMIIRAVSFEHSKLWICKGYYGGADLVENCETGTRVLRTVLQGYSVTDCVMDHERGLWFSTLEKGIFYMPYPEVEELSGFPIAPGEKFVSLCVFDSRHILALSSAGNICSPGQDMIHLLKDQSRYSYYSCMQTCGNRLGIGSYHSSCIYEPSTGRSMPIVDSSGAIVPLVTLSAIDSVQLYGVSIRSLYRIDSRTGHAQMEVSLLPERIRCICTGRNDTLWLGGLTGLWALPSGGLPMNMGEQNPELSERIDFLYYDSLKNRLWLSSKGKGLMLIESGRVIDLSGLTPAIPATCRAIYADEERKIWVATNLGAYCISETGDGKFHSREYSVRNGLPSNDIIGITRRGDTMWLAAADRIIRFMLSRYPVNTTPPPLKVKMISADGHEIIPWPADSVHEFSAGTGTITFTYSALSFKSLGHINYLFRLDGADTSWQSTQATEAVFYALPPGEYSFNLVASNNDGVATRPVTLRFVILPPFWQRWWFILTSVVIIAGTLLAITRFRIQQLRRTQLFNQRLVEMEMTALRAQMSPHFIFNAISSIHNFVLTGNSNTSAVYLAKFARLIRNVLENSSKKQITLAREIETLRLYLEIERMRFSEEFSFVITTDPTLDPERVTIIPLLLQPYVENAIWHGLLHKKDHGSLHVSIRDAGEMLSCIIDDDGVGREAAAINKQDRAARGSSMGGDISQRRLDLLNDLYGTKYSATYIDKKSADGSSAGTRVELLIPKFIKP